jgi:hypothetical protein
MEVKKAWVYTSTPPYIWMMLCLVKLQGQLILQYFQKICNYRGLNYVVLVSLPGGEGGQSIDGWTG